jgi:hypothetical protein
MEKTYWEIHLKNGDIISDQRNYFRVGNSSLNGEHRFYTGVDGDLVCIVSTEMFSFCIQKDVVDNSDKE